MSTMKMCVRCSKVGGDVYTCEGCKTCFCFDHLVQHRQELAIKMDEIGQQHDLLQNDLEHQANKVESHPIFTQINEWEQESIIKIQVIAEAARADLQQQLETRTYRLKTNFSKLSKSIRACRNSTYSESDLMKWIEELQQIRREFEKLSATLKITYDSQVTTVNFIRIISNDEENNTSESSPAAIAQEQVSIHKSSRSRPYTDSVPNRNTEQFKTVIGDAVLTDNNLVAKKSNIYSTSIRGANLYTTGIHEIQFRIEHLSNNSIFIGIISSTQQMTSTAFKLSSAYGWWDTNFPVVAGIHNVHGIYSTRTGDKVTITLACDEIGLIYHNTRCASSKMSVDINRCPFPWQILVILGAGENIIRILV
ncbi:unnamed protein product [Rotaria sp. Silwood2]|nr:unnamed protein product [Rotaria sp. Silwood2]